MFLAQAMGKVGEGTSNTFLANLDMVTQALTGTSSVNQDKLDLFQAVYKANEDKYMFSGEVMDATDGFVSEVMDNYIFCYSVAMNCLDAYRQVLSFTEDDVNALSVNARNAYNNINTIIVGTVCATMENLALDITGRPKTTTDKSENNTDKSENSTDKSETSTGVAQHYADYYARDRFVYINKGKAKIHLSDTLIAAAHPVYDVARVTYFGQGMAGYENEGVDAMLRSNPMTEKDTQDLVNYIKNEWKKGSILDYLKERGFKWIGLLISAGIVFGGGMAIRGVIRAGNWIVPRATEIEVWLTETTRPCVRRVVRLSIAWAAETVWVVMIVVR